MVVKKWRHYRIRRFLIEIMRGMAYQRVQYYYDEGDDIKPERFINIRFVSKNLSKQKIKRNNKPQFHHEIFQRNQWHSAGN